MQDQVVMFPVPLDELIARITAEVTKKVEKTLVDRLPQAEVKWITQTEACEKLRCSHYTFKEHLKKFKIDTHYVGNSIRYREDQVMSLPKI